MLNITREEAWEKWISYLRSDEAKRHKGSLESATDENARCCLGHACHVLGIERHLYSEEEDLNGVFYGQERSLAFLPREAAELLGISRRGGFKQFVDVQDNPNFPPYGITNLTAINDNTELSLHEIADIIEEQYQNDNFLCHVG